MKKISITQYADAYREIEIMVPDDFEVEDDERQFTEEEMEEAAGAQGIGWEIGGATGEYEVDDVEENVGQPESAESLIDKMEAIDKLIDSEEAVE